MNLHHHLSVFLTLCSFKKILLKVFICNMQTQIRRPMLGGYPVGEAGGSLPSHPLVPRRGWWWLPVTFGFHSAPVTGQGCQFHRPGPKVGVTFPPCPAHPVCGAQGAGAVNTGSGMWSPLRIVRPARRLHGGFSPLSSESSQTWRPCSLRPRSPCR